jgi:hypothetical protein
MQLTVPEVIEELKGKVAGVKTVVIFSKTTQCPCTLKLIPQPSFYNFYHIIDSIYQGEFFDGCYAVISTYLRFPAIKALYISILSSAGSYVSYTITQFY